MQGGRGQGNGALGEAQRRFVVLTEGTSVRREERGGGGSWWEEGVGGQWQNMFPLAAVE